MSDLIGRLRKSAPIANHQLLREAANEFEERAEWEAWAKERIHKLAGERLDALSSLDEAKETIERLERELAEARAEVRALSGDPEALDPYLPEGWWSNGHGWNKGALGVYPPIPGQRGTVSWVNHEAKGGRAHLTRKGVLAAMRAAEEAENETKTSPEDPETP